MRRSLPFLVLVAACGANPPPTPALVVTVPTIYRHGAESTSVPGDTHRYFVEAQVDDGSGHVRRMAGEPDGQGTFRLDGVHGAAWVRVFDTVDLTEQWVWTDAPALDLGTDLPGRPDRVRAIKRPTNLVIHGEGLDPWRDFDELQFGDPNRGFTTNIANTYFSDHNPQLGDTTFDPLTLNWAGFPLADAAKGDRAWITQTRNFHDEAHGLSWTGPIRAGTLEGLTQQDGVPSEAHVALTEPPAGTYRLHWKRSAFAALQTAVHPTRAGDARQETWVRAIPGGTSHGRIYPYELPVVTGVWPPDGSDDLDVSFPLRNPYPTSWLVENFVFDFQVRYVAPGGPDDGDADLDAEIGVLATSMPEEGIVPLVSPVREPTLGGRTLFAKVDKAGETPVLAWQAPSTGAPTSYEIHVYSTFSDHMPGPHPGVRLILNELASLVVPGDRTSVTLPVGVLAQGDTYFLRMRAVMEPGQDIRRAPFRHSLPSAWADLATDYVTP